MAAAKSAIRGKEHPLYRKMDRLCEWCGDVFLAIPAKVAMGEGRFCSRRCIGSWQSSRQHGRRSAIEDMTEAELTRLGLDFSPQHQLGPWLVDFYLPDHRAVVECDGDYWHSLPRSQARDRQKNGWMWRNGYRILRLSEADIRAGQFGTLGEFALGSAS